MSVDDTVLPDAVFPLIKAESEIRPFLKARNTLSAAFELTISQLSLAITVLSDEETITGSMLGSLVSNYFWCALYPATPEADAASCGWSSYSKSSTGDKSETRSGADFALVIQSGERAKIAVFQAKKGTEDSGGRIINVYRRVKEAVRVDVDASQTLLEVPHYVNTGCTVAQIALLRKTLTDGARIAANAVGDRPPSEEWVHYLGYFKGDAACLHFAKIEPGEVTRLETAAQSRSDVRLTADNSDPLLDVLEAGLNPASPWWLDLPLAEAEKWLPEIIELMTVNVVDDGTAERSLVLNPKLNDIQGIAAIKRRPVGDSQAQNIDEAPSGDLQDPSAHPPEISVDAVVGAIGRRKAAAEKTAESAPPVSKPGDR